jgi:putative endonuclease
MRKYFTYILATHRNGTLYWGVTGNLVHRIWQHRAGQTPGFSGGQLVWFEEHLDLRSTLRRQIQIARCTHAARLSLIEQTNPAWRDLYDTLLVRPVRAWQKAA